jgi:hypothetical protein
VFDHFSREPYVTLDFFLKENQTVRWSFTVETVDAAVPEVATWGMMIVGFGFVGAAGRSRSRIAVWTRQSAPWMLKQAQHDGQGERPLSTLVRHIV